ncbi:MAG: XRE family transcriptional regulator [Oscillospiraceae bacterium]|nr:XRE family transcriptional regulator [Oscillospiraceae bacterium]
MGSGATKAVGNPWYEARMEAAKADPRLFSREGAAELLGMSVSSVADAELSLSKSMPVDKAVLMSDLYKDPALLNYFCLHECPIGRRRPISDDTIEIERATVKLTKILRKETVQWFKHGLQDIAADGMVSEDELEAFDAIVDELREVSKIISELEIIRDKSKAKKVVK